MIKRILLHSLQTYFSVLQKEVAIVYKKEGMGKAIFSNSFLTSFIPGIVMSILFGQMMLFAEPIKLALPSQYTPQGTYSKKLLQTQKEKLIVIGSKKRLPKEWGKVDENIGAVINLVPGLSVITVPSLGFLTPTLRKIALSFPDVQILKISDYKEVQVRVSTKNLNINPEQGELIEKELVEQLRLIYGDGVEVMFRYRLPTVGGAPPEVVPLYISLCVKVEHLLDLIRTLQDNENLKIDQIYDFWGH